MLNSMESKGLLRQLKQEQGPITPSRRKLRLHRDTFLTIVRADAGCGWRECTVQRFALSLSYYVVPFA